MKISCVEACSRVDDLALRLVEARSFIHSTLSLKYGPTDVPSEP